MKIVLFGLTGIGNAVLRALCETGRTPILIVTRHETGKYPYYDETQIIDEARKLGIPVLLGEDGEKETIRLAPDVIFSATYHRLISPEVISAAKHRFNLHPSLLPAYPGKNPFYWALINGEVNTGISIHRLTGKFDQGEIVFQRGMQIRADETQGSLRFALANLAGQAAKDFFLLLENDSLPVIVQSSSGVKSPHRIEEHVRVINLKATFESIERQLRSLTPWPLPVLKEVDEVVQEIQRIDSGACSSISAGSVISIDGNLVRAKLADSEAIFVVRLDKAAG